MHMLPTTMCNMRKSISWMVADSERVCPTSARRLAEQVHRRHMVVADHNDHTDCEEPVLIKHVDGQMYAQVPTWSAGDNAGFTSVKRGFMNPRRRHTLKVDAARCSVSQFAMFVALVCTRCGSVAGQCFLGWQA
jgi:hypothetical protein